MSNARRNLKLYGKIFGSLTIIYVAPFLPHIRTWPYVFQRMIFPNESHRSSIQRGDVTLLTLGNDSLEEPRTTSIDSYRVSVIVPLYNEGKTNLSNLLNTLNTRTRQPIQVVLVDAGCSDDTLAAVSNEYPKLNIVLVQSKNGRGAALKKGAETANGGYLLFVHADCEPPMDFDMKIRKALHDRNTIMTTFRFQIQGESTFGRKIIENTTEFRSSSLWLPYGDQCYGFRKSEYLKIGGFRDIKMMEDLDLVTRVREYAIKNGMSIHVLPDAAKCASRRWDKNGLVKNSALNWYFVALYQFGLASPDDIYIKYYGQK